MTDNDASPANPDAGTPSSDAQTQPVETRQSAPARGTRRFWIATGVGAVTLAGVSGVAFAAGTLRGATFRGKRGATSLRDLTPSVAGQDDELTPPQQEGPYFKANSPERASLVDASSSGTRLSLSGKVVSQSGSPFGKALLDFWQADPNGAYDNRGYTLRGHQFSGADGGYRLETVVPGLYPGRTRHIHVKVQAPGGPILTTQVYFPDEARNARDGMFDPRLLMKQTATENGVLLATFDFVVTS